MSTRDIPVLPAGPSLLASRFSICSQSKIHPRVIKYYSLSRLDAFNAHTLTIPSKDSLPIPSQPHHPPDPNISHDPRRSQLGRAFPFHLPFHLAHRHPRQEVS